MTTQGTHNDFCKLLVINKDCTALLGRKFYEQRVQTTPYIMDVCFMRNRQKEYSHLQRHLTGRPVGGRSTGW